MSAAVQVAVGAIARRGDEILLVRRGQEPGAGEWSVPGGRVRLGEELHEAVVREVAEETGLEVLVERFVGWVERIGAEPDPYHFVILDFLVSALDPSPPPTPGDDAAEAAWVRLDELDGLPLVEGLLDFLVDHSILDPAHPIDLGFAPPG